MENVNKKESKLQKSAPFFSSLFTTYAKVGTMLEMRINTNRPRMA